MAAFWAVVCPHNPRRHIHCVYALSYVKLLSDHWGKQQQAADSKGDTSVA